MLCRYLTYYSTELSYESLVSSQQVFNNQVLLKSNSMILAKKPSLLIINFSIRKIHIHKNCYTISHAIRYIHKIRYIQALFYPKIFSIHNSSSRKRSSRYTFHSLDTVNLTNSIEDCTLSLKPLYEH